MRWGRPCGPWAVWTGGSPLGVAGLYIMPGFPAGDAITAAAIGVVSGLAATGAQQAVKQRLLLRLKDEDPAHPLSDQALCALLTGEGISVARRTVAKYRMELGIGTASARRKRRGTK